MAVASVLMVVFVWVLFFTFEVKVYDDAQFAATIHDK